MLINRINWLLVSVVFSSSLLPFCKTNILLYNSFHLGIRGLLFSTYACALLTLKYSAQWVLSLVLKTLVLDVFLKIRPSCKLRPWNSRLVFVILIIWWTASCGEACIFSNLPKMFEKLKKSSNNRNLITKLPSKSFWSWGWMVSLSLERESTVMLQNYQQMTKWLNNE